MPVRARLISAVILHHLITHGGERRNIFRDILLKSILILCTIGCVNGMELFLSPSLAEDNQRTESETVPCEYPSPYCSVNSEGVRLVKEGEVDLAIKKFEEALAIAPNGHTVLFNLGFAYYQKGNLEKASEFFVRAMSVTTSESSTYKDAMIGLEKIREKRRQD